MKRESKGYPYLRKTLIFLKSQKRRVIGVFCCVIIYMAICMLYPMLEGNILGSFADSSKADYTTKLIIILLIVSVVSAANLFVWNLLFFRIRRDMIFDIRRTQIKCSMDISSKVHDKVGSGKFINRIIWDSAALAELYTQIIEVSGDILASVGIFIYAFIVNYWIGIYLLITVAILIAIEFFRINLIYKMRKIRKEKDDTATSFYNETIMGNKDIKSLNISDISLDKAKVRFKDSTDYNYKLETTNTWLKLLSAVCDHLFYLGFFVLSAFLLDWGALLVSAFIVLYLYRGRIANSLVHAVYAKEELSKGEISARRVYSLIEDKEFEQEHFGTQQLDNVRGDIEFKNVCFEYKENEPVLTNLNLKIMGGHTVGIVGKSGNGKSTILSLIDKMYNVTSGEILLDGVDINDLSQECLRGNITYVSQFPYMFNYSLYENLRWVKPKCTKKEIINACKHAQIHDFIMSLPQKYNTIVGENATSISGGQKQRVAIARALLKNSKIILFDEATSSLDNESQDKIKKAISDLGHDHTVVIVAHRLTTVEDCDYILFIDKGKVAAKGTHQELLAKSKGYRELYQEELTCSIEEQISLVEEE